MRPRRRWRVIRTRRYAPLVMKVLYEVGGIFTSSNCRTVCRRPHPLCRFDVEARGLEHRFDAVAFGILVKSEQAIHPLTGGQPKSCISRQPRTGEMLLTALLLLISNSVRCFGRAFRSRPKRHAAGLPCQRMVIQSLIA